MPEDPLGPCETELRCLGEPGDWTCRVVYAPVLDGVEIHLNPVTGNLRIDILGTDRDSNTQRGGEIQYQFADGGSLPADGGFVPIEFVGFYVGNGVFGGFYTDQLALGVVPVSASLRITDATGVTSVPFEAEVRRTPLVGPGASCDPDGIYSACEAGLACFDPNVRDQVIERRCGGATPPVLDRATATRGIYHHSFRVSGHDPERNIAGLELRFVGADDRPISLWPGLDEALPFVLPFLAVSADPAGNFIALASENGIEYLICLELSNRAYEACRDVPADSDDCSDRTQALYTECTEGIDLDAAGVVGVEIVVVDASNLRSDPLIAAIEPAPVRLEPYATCLPDGAIGNCPPPQRCLTIEDELPVCTEVVDTCDVDHPVIDLGALEPGPDGAYQVAGDNRLSPVVTHGTCGGGGPTDIYAITGRATGIWTFTTSALEPGVTDTLIYVRYSCEHWGTELACNDDDQSGQGGPASAVTAPVYDGMTTYIFVDSHAGQTPGPYTLTARPVARL